MASYGDGNNQLISSNLLAFWAFPLEALVIIYPQHMTILRRLDPPLQWNVIVLDIKIGKKYVVQP